MSTETRNVFVKIIEAKDFRPASFRGKIETLVTVSSKGNQKDKMKTKVVFKSRTPKWYEEFMIQVALSNFTLDFYLQDWNLVGTNKLVGHATLNLETVVPGEMADMWLSLNTSGGIRVQVKVYEPGAKQYLEKPRFGMQQFLHPDRPADLTRQKVERYRLELERTSYYPGERVRGIVVFNQPKSKDSTKYSLKIAVHAFASQSQGKMGALLSAEASAHDHLNLAIPLLKAATVSSPPSSSSSKSAPKVEEMTAGSTYFPFEFWLPFHLPPSASITTVIGNSTVSLGNRCLVIAEMTTVGMAGPKVRKLKVDLFIKSHLPTLCRDLRLNLLPAEHGLGGPVSIQGPSLAWIGEPYAFRLNINTANASARTGSIAVRLEMHEFYTQVQGEYGNAQRHLLQAQAKHRIPLQLSRQDCLQGFPLDVNTVWEGDIAVDIPATLTQRSLHASVSPTVQCYYDLVIELIPSTQAFSQAPDGAAAPDAANTSAPPGSPSQAPQTPHVVAVGRLPIVLMAREDVGDVNSENVRASKAWYLEQMREIVSKGLNKTIFSNFDVANNMDKLEGDGPAKDPHPATQPPKLVAWAGISPTDPKALSLIAPMLFPTADFSPLFPESPATYSGTKPFKPVVRFRADLWVPGQLPTWLSSLTPLPHDWHYADFQLLMATLIAPASYPSQPPPSASSSAPQTDPRTSARVIPTDMTSHESELIMPPDSYVEDPYMTEESARSLSHPQADSPAPSVDATSSNVADLAIEPETDPELHDDDASEGQGGIVESDSHSGEGGSATEEISLAI